MDEQYISRYFLRDKYKMLTIFWKLMERLLQVLLIIQLFFSFQDCMDRVVFKHQAMGDFDTNVYSHDRIILTNINHRIINKCSASCPWLLPTDGLIIVTQELSNFSTSTLKKNQFAIGIEINDEQWNSNLQVIILSVLPLYVPGMSSMLYLL